MPSIHDSEMSVCLDEDVLAVESSKDGGDIPPDAHFNPYLDIPSSGPPLHRRSSLASTFSDISDLSFMANDYADRPLMRTASNASAHSSGSTVTPSGWRQRFQVIYYQNYGALLVLLSQFFGSGMNVTTRLLEQQGAHGPGMHPFQILFVRQSLTAFLCTTYALTTKSIPHFPLGPPDRRVRRLLVCRGLFGFFGVVGMYFSLLYLPLSEATVLTFLAPILTCYACSLLIPGETFTRQQQIAGFVSLIGVVFIAHPSSLFSSSAPSPTVAETSSAIQGGPAIAPANSTSNPVSDHDPRQPTSSQHLFAIVVAMVGVVGSTGAMTAIRSIGTRAHAFISVNYFSVWSTIVSLVALIVIPDVSFRLPDNFTEWALLLSLGICGFVMQCLLTMGLSYGGPSTPASAKTFGPQTAAEDLSTTKSTDDIEMQACSQTRNEVPNHNHRRLSISSPAEPSTSTSSLSHRKSSLTKPRPQPRSAPKSPPKPSPSGNRATSMVYCQMLFALTADKLIFGTTPGVWSWIGSGLILAGAVWVAAAKDGGSTARAEAEAESARSRAAAVATNGNNIDSSNGKTTAAVYTQTGRQELGRTQNLTTLEDEQNRSDSVGGYRTRVRHKEHDDDELTKQNDGTAHNSISRSYGQSQIHDTRYDTI